MDKSLLKSAIALFCAGAIASCQESTFDSVPSPQADGSIPTFLDDSDPYIGSEKELSSSDAVKVARLYCNGNSESRTTPDMTVKNVVTIPDSDGNPAIYAVNL
ncbi:MAG: hypothetical protein NC127_03035, partial [Muribaculum sp.]|nr:hypothetical protein [Muribaculum sp.]